MHVNRLSRLALVVALVAPLPPTVAAQEIQNQLYRKFELDLTGDLLVFSTTLRVDPTNRPELGTEVSLEGDLGSQRANFQPRGALRWRLGRRHELEAGYLRAVRSHQRQLARTISFADTSFTAGARIESSFRTSQAFLNYRYAFRARDQSQIGVALGLGAIFLRGTIDALTSTASGTDSVSYAAERKLTAPFASIGPYGRFRIGDRWYLETDIRGVYLKVSNFKASVIEGGVAARRFFSNRFGAELGYGFGFYSVRVDRPASGSGFLGIDFTGKFKYTVNGFRGGIIIML
jgi:hypothetical protein